jgi:hypothetical protein
MIVNVWINTALVGEVKYLFCLRVLLLVDGRITGSCKSGSLSFSGEGCNWIPRYHELCSDRLSLTTHCILEKQNELCLLPTVYVHYVLNQRLQRLNTNASSSASRREAVWGDGAPGGADEMPQGERQCIFATSLSSKVKCLTVLCVLLETDFVMHSDTPEPNLLL